MAMHTWTEMKARGKTIGHRCSTCKLSWPKWIKPESSRFDLANCTKEAGKAYEVRTLEDPQ